MAADPVRILPWPSSAIAATRGVTSPIEPIATRLAALCPTTGADAKARIALLGAGRSYAAHKQIASEGDLPVAPRAVRSGWIGATRIFADGRRQIHHLILPGELLLSPAGYHATAGLVALTPVTLVTLERPAQSGALDAAFGRDATLSTHYLLNQTARLGRQLAYQRVGHLLLELRDRLLLSGSGTKDDFPMPLTQEALGDVLGLTSVHVNRTLQMLRRDDMIRIGGGTVTLLKPAALARMADYSAPVPIA